MNSQHCKIIRIYTVGFVFCLGVFWVGAMTYFFKGKYLMLSALLLFWIDILFMPFLAQYEMLELKPNWLIGELLLNI